MLFENKTLPVFRFLFFSPYSWGLKKNFKANGNRMRCNSQVYLSSQVFKKHHIFSSSDLGYWIYESSLKIPYIKLCLVSSTKFSLWFIRKAYFLTIVPYLSFLLPENPWSTAKILPLPSTFLKQAIKQLYIFI